MNTVVIKNLLSHLERVESPPKIGETYTLRVPFHLSVGADISHLDVPVEHAYGNLKLTLERQDDIHEYVLEVQGFSSEEAAKSFLPEVGSGLAWVALNDYLGFSVSPEFEEVLYHKDPDDVTVIFGAANGNRLTVFESNRLMMLPTIPKGHKLTLERPASRILAMLVEGIENITAKPDTKTQTAIELYSAYYYERSLNARFLTLVMALEVLAPKRNKHEVVLQLVSEWQEMLESKKSLYAMQSAEHADLKALGDELLFRKEASIGSRIRTTIIDTLTAVNHPNPTQIVSLVKKIYKGRSTLVHDGKLPELEMKQLTQQAEAVVKLLITIKLTNKLPQDTTHQVK